MFENIRGMLFGLFNFCFMIDKNITFTFEAQHLLSGKDVFIKNNRYYLPLNKMMNKLGGKALLEGVTLTLLFFTKYYKADISSIKHISKCETIYISLFDIVKILGLKTRWDHEKKEIRLYRDRDMKVKTPCPAKGRPALIRFEDITAGPLLTNSKNLEKLRIISDYLYFKCVPFHVAWIPKYVDPPQKIENDVSCTYSIENADFVFTLDHIIWRGGIIGIHGYTHQCGMEITAEGTEFSDKCNSDERSVRKRIEVAISSAKRLDIPVVFFESPHYASTEFQQSIEEQYFDYVYEPYVGIWGDKVVISPRNRWTVYVPTPLGYISANKTVEQMVSEIRSLPKDIIASLFYHPSIEMDYITLGIGENGYPLHSYLRTSILHRIVDALLENGRKPIRITEIENIPTI